MMAETIKSALFVDYDSFHRSQDDADGDVAARLAQTSVAWVAAIESGKLILPPAEDGARRRVLIRRCYADPALLGLHRSALIAGGFEVVDCPQQPGRKRNAADLNITIDTLDALHHPAGYDEFILLSADADFTPVLLRLRAHNRTTAIYGDEAVSAAYRAIADGTVDAARFAAVLAGETLDPKPEPIVAESPSDGAGDGSGFSAAPDRADIEALARKVQAATNVPMFSPRTFADLFRVLAQEIGENGYHFQNTAENVTEKLTAAGRNVNRRQVLFVVKGLALKGHVFSTTDTPERLAEVFREQVLYLAGNSGTELDEREKAMLPAWILGRSPVPVKPASPPAPTATPPRPPAPAEAAARKADAPPARRRVPPRPGAGEKESPVVAARAEPVSPEIAEPPPEPRVAAPPPPPPVLKTAAPVAALPPPAPPRPSDPRNSVASRFAAITKGSFGAKPGEAAPRPKPAPRPAAEAPVPPSRPPAGQKPSGSAGRASGTSPAAPSRPGGAKATQAKAAPEGDALESSILAAIAQAVDVLVDDNGEKPAARPETAAAPDDGDEVELEIVAVEVVESAPEQPPEPEPSPGGDSEDIGDEIQRIIASYSRARQQTD